MIIFTDILRLIISIMIVFLAGKLISKLRLPSILGWLIAGMILGPYAVNLLGGSVLESQWFKVLESIFECTFGLIIGSELIWSKIKKAGPQIMITTITESIGTFLVVSLIFGVIFYFTHIPLYLAFIFGGIALATAPAPSLSVVRDMKTKGPVTNTIIPMAALDDLVGSVVFFLVIAFVSAHISTAGISVPVVLFLVFLPVFVGIMTGFLAGLLLRHAHTNNSTIFMMIFMMIVSIGIGFLINILLPAPIFNFTLLGMAYSTMVANIATKEQLNHIMTVMNPIIGLSMIVVILNLGAPLDYHLIAGASVYTIIYIIARAIGKYSGAWFGATISHAPQSVRKYLGFTLLPHSGVSLIFTGIAVSVLSGPAPEYAATVQGTIAAAAVINEFIAVFMAKKGFEWAGELNKSVQSVTV